MLTIHGSGSRYCDGVTRRQALQIGGLALGGVALPQLLQAEASSGSRSQKSIIMIFLTGGPPHQDMVDLKMGAPVEIRGEFQPIRTCVPGIDICELMPRTAKMMDKLAIIRSLNSGTMRRDRAHLFVVSSKKTCIRQSSPVDATSWGVCQKGEDAHDQ